MRFTLSGLIAHFKDGGSDTCKSANRGHKLSPSNQTQEGRDDGQANLLLGLPHECLDTILSFTSFRDVCNLALTCKDLRDSILSTQADLSSWASIRVRLEALAAFANERDLRVVIPGSANGIMRRNGVRALLVSAPAPSSGARRRQENPPHVQQSCARECYQLSLHVPDVTGLFDECSISASAMSITWGDDPRYWDKAVTCCTSRFGQVASLKLVWWFEIRGDWVLFLPPAVYVVNWRMRRTPQTNTGSFCEWGHGLWDSPICARVETSAGDTIETSLHIYETLMKKIGDVWTEFDVGSFQVIGGAHGRPQKVCIKFSLFDNANIPKTSLQLDCITIRAIYCKPSSVTSWILLLACLIDSIPSFYYVCCVN